MNLFGLDRRVNRYLQKFERNYISFDEMKEMVLDWYEPMKIFTTKKDGTRMIREMYTVAGPSGNMKYNYQAKGYMVLYDIGGPNRKAGFRTIIFKNVYKVEKDGETYFVR